MQPDEVAAQAQLTQGLGVDEAARQQQTEDLKVELTQRMASVYRASGHDTESREEACGSLTGRLARSLAQVTDLSVDEAARHLSETMAAQEIEEDLAAQMVAAQGDGPE
jgi:hypothetical protein